jgi:acetyl esterase
MSDDPPAPDPALHAFLAGASRLPLTPTDGPGIVEQRRAAQAGMRPLVAPLVDEADVGLAAVFDRHVACGAGDVRVRVYVPSDAGARAALVYCHGGGWWLGSIEMADAVCRDRAARSGCVILSVDYHLSPEHRFPVALDDCDTTLGWLVAHADELGVDATRVAVGGTSAGANLAAATALRVRDRGGPPLAFQLLEMPVLDARAATASMGAFARGCFLTAEAVRAAWRLYLGGAPPDAYASPSLAEDLAGLPPTFVVTAECDPLRDEGEAYARRLRLAGVPATLRRYDGMVHGFQAFTGALPAARQCRADLVAALRAALVPGPPAAPDHPGAGGTDRLEFLL